jgi:hypothetical protein
MYLKKIGIFFCFLLFFNISGVDAEEKKYIGSADNINEEVTSDTNVGTAKKFGEIKPYIQIGTEIRGGLNIYTHDNLNMLSFGIGKSLISGGKADVGPYTPLLTDGTRWTQKNGPDSAVIENIFFISIGYGQTLKNKNIVGFDILFGASKMPEIKSSSSSIPVDGGGASFGLDMFYLYKKHLKITIGFLANEIEDFKFNGEKYKIMEDMSCFVWACGGKESSIKTTDFLFSIGYML